MNASDISRFLVQPRKHYVEAMQQQGRVVTDADWNEGAALNDEDRRRALRDLIGPSGSPDEGFAPDLAAGDEVIPTPVAFNGAAPVDVLPYRIRPGTLYVEGQRFVHDGREGLGDPVAMQRNFLQMAAGEAPAAAPGTTHAQFHYLRGWEQWVASVEDAELAEVALGGLDTSLRVRRMAQVAVEEVDPDTDCEAAWAAIRAGIEAETGGTFTASGTKLDSSARLRIALIPGEALDPCAPCSADDPGRYLGADNQAIRIMMAAPDRYVFALDNAGPIYRVRTGAAADGLIPVTMLTEPADEARWPLSNTVAEVMPWGALLSNGQKVSRVPGVFLRVAQGYDPDSRGFAFGAADQPELDTLTRVWDDGHSDRGQLPNDNDPEGDYLYVRFWHRLDDAGDPVLLDTAGPHVLLNRLGIDPVFAGTGIAGDHWTVAMRPNTPRAVVPWDLTQPGGVPPHGPMRLFAPLALVTFRPPQPGESENAEVIASVEDCRPRFTPLVDRDGCCTHSVGDGVTSFGDYASIQAAIDNLPAEGGRVCLLPGLYEEEVLIDRDDVHLEGCGTASRVATPGNDPAAALIRTRGSRLTLKDLALETRGQIGIQVNDEAPDGEMAAADIRIEGVGVLADQREGLGGQTRTGIDVRRARRVTIEASSVEMSGSLTDDAGMVVGGEDIRVARCRIESLPAEGTSSAWAGCQIRGGARRVTVERCTIRGGVGHGITLGSLVWRSDTTVTTGFGAGAGLVNMQDPCAPTGVLVKPVAVANTRFDASSAGDLEDIRILDNLIQQMSANGISVLTILPLDEATGAGQRITTDRIEIRRNRIRGCVDQSSRLRDLSPAPKVKKLEPGEVELGGQFTVSETRDAAIFLAEGNGIVIRDNEIRDNGAQDPRPVAGISILFGDAIVIEDNHIRNNGLRQSASIPVADGSQAAIFVSLAGIATNRPTDTEADALGFSLRIAGNVVDHPNGPALTARATGPVAVTGNHLLSQGSNASAQAAGYAACVALTNLGPPAEAADLGPGEPSPDRWLMPPGTPEYLGRQANGTTRIGQGGRILFSRNHVTLNWVEPASVGLALAASFSVMLCSQDDVTCTANQFALNVEDPGTKKSGDTVLARQPRMSAHLVAVGAAANVSRNRVAEGVNDALISVLTLGGFLASATENVTTHLGFVSTLRSFTPNSSDPPSGDPQFRIDRGNLVWLTPAEETSTASLVSLTTVRATANQLFAAFAESCLGVDSGRGPFDFRAFLTLGPING
jgi:hypothetical protein